jgi:hypothetical protein
VERSAGYKMLTKLLTRPKAFFLFVFITSVVFPITGGVLNLVSCPGPAGLAYFPIFSARCLGELLGDIGIFFFGLPGLMTSFIILFSASWLIESVGNLSSEVQLSALIVLGLILNFVIYWFGFRFVLTQAENFREMHSSEQNSRVES